MLIGIALEKDMNRPFAVSLANAQTPGLTEEILRDDVRVLREEWDAVLDRFHKLITPILDKALEDVEPIKAEIRTILAQAQAAGFDTKGW